MRLSLVILTYNEIIGLKTIWDKISLTGIDEVIAVDGGSMDGSIDFLKSKGVPVYGQAVQGRGEAFRIAFEKTHSEALIFFSPDGNEDPSDIQSFRPYLESGNDMVIANRMTHGGHNEEDENILRIRKWANLAFTWLANHTWNCTGYVNDTINGFRAITRNAWQEMSPDGAGYVIEYQCSIRAFKKRMKIIEFSTHEYSRIDTREGSTSIKTGLAFLRLYFSELLGPVLKFKRSRSRSDFY